MTEIKIKRKLDKIIEIVYNLRKDGLVQGVDFDFSYHQSKWDDMIGEIPEETKFIFYNDELAMMFALKHGS
jgi:hypothetical protein